MAGQSTITLDHIRNYFSLNCPIEKLDVAPTVTGGLGINNTDEFPPPEPEISMRNKDQEYTLRYIEEEEDLLSEQYENTEDVPSKTDGLNSLEELSTAVGDIGDVDNLESEQAELIYSRFYKKEIKYNSNMLISEYKEKILQLVDIYQIVIIQGPTGCGKTTQVPQYILDQHAMAGQHCNIIVTQPRKIAAISIARRMCEERNWQMGSIVGYQVGMDNKTSSDTRISFVTTGVLLQKLVNNRHMNMYTHIILDEVHERDQDTDFALLVVKKLLKTNSRNVKVILMSATIDPSIFSNYFFTGLNATSSVVEILGKSKEVTEYYLNDLSALGVELPDQDFDQPCFPEELYKLIDHLLIIFDKIEKAEQDVPRDREFAPVRGTILIFLPGYDEISTMMDKLGNHAFKVTRKLDLIPLHSSITIEEQTRAFKPAKEGHRKIIISTNIAESSITVPDIKYVIDSCLTKNLVCDQDTNYTSLRLEWASKSNCTQRKGRAGRVDVGRVYRMVKREFYYNYLPDYNIPEIMRCPLTQTILFTKKLDFGEPKALLALAIDPPALCDIQNAVLLLKEVGALSITANGIVSSYDGDLTFVGNVMASLPLDVRISKLITYGYVFSCLEECIIIAASLSLKSFLAKPFQRLMDSYRSALSWADGTFSDCLAYLNAYKMWKEFKRQGQFSRPGGMKENDWARNNYIQLKRIKEVDLLVEEIKKRLLKQNISIDYQLRKEIDPTTEILILKIVIAGAFYPNYFIQNPIDEKNIMKELSNGDPLTTVIISALPHNHGVLYYNALHSLLEVCSSKMTIEFEGRKAYVKFDRRFVDPSKPRHNTEILPAVYFAVKMRDLKVPLELTVFNKAEADRKIEQLKKLQIQHSSSDITKRLISNRMTVHDFVHTFKSPKLPGLNQLTVEIVVTYVVNCGHFWAREASQTIGNLMCYIDDIVNNKMVKHLQPLTRQVTCGMLVLAPYTEPHSKPLYYRATVEMIMANQSVMVFFIDYGNSCVVKNHELRQISVECEEVMETEALAFECHLSELKLSAVKSSNFNWSQNAKQWFQNKVMRKVMIGKLYSVVQNVVRMELYEKDNHIVSINSQLKKHGFAEDAEESCLSKQNYEARKSAEEVSLLSTKNPEELYFSPVDLEAEAVRKTHHKVRLHGPHSPLEVTYSGVTCLDRSKLIKVDRDSVNSVSLNAEPQDKHQQMLVASAISLSQHTNALTLRSTTLMPKIKELLNLVTLIFTPCAEFRTDRERKNYTGALCGLGYDDYSNCPLYPEHDMELTFESLFDYEDVANINRVRMAINMVLSNESELASWNPRSIQEVQKILHTNLLELLNKNRISCDPCHYSKSHKWKQMPSQFVLHPQVNDGVQNPVLPLHPCVNLQKSLQKELREHVNFLKSSVKNSTKPEPFLCRLCGIKVPNPRELLFHLDTDEHQKKENELLK